jgi:hypothetical protein
MHFVIDLCTAEGFQVDVTILHRVEMFTLLTSSVFPTVCALFLTCLATAELIKLILLLYTKLFHVILC